MNKKTNDTEHLVHIEWLGVREDDGAYASKAATSNAQRPALNQRVPALIWKTSYWNSVPALFVWLMLCLTPEQPIMSPGNSCAAELRHTETTVKSKQPNRAKISFIN
jgi:hypothetical protein